MADEAPPKRHPLWPSALALAAAAVALVTACGAARGSPPGPLRAETATPASAHSISGMVVPGRSRLALCADVAGVPPLGPDAVAARVRSALAQVTRHPLWASSGLAAPAPIVDAGCPLPPRLLEPDTQFDSSGHPTLHPTPARVSPGPYRLFVFVVPRAELEARLRGWWQYRTWPEEFLMFSHDHFAEVTTGLYLTPADLLDESFVREWLVEALSLNALDCARQREARRTPTPPSRPRPLRSDRC